MKYNMYMASAHKHSGWCSLKNLIKIKMYMYTHIPTHTNYLILD